MTSTVNERIKTNKILMDICNFDKSLFDTSTLSYDEIKYYNSITRGFDKQIQFFIDWLDSDEARRIFYENESYNEEVFNKIEDEIKEIVGNTSLKADEIITRIYDSGLQAGADEIKRTKYYNDATKYGLEFLQDYNFELIKNINTDLANHIRAEIFTGIAAGESMPEVAKRILTSTNNSLTGKTLTAKQRAMMIARTETARAMTQGRLQSYANYGVREVKILTAGDESVCAICRKAADKIFPISEAGNQVPFHPLCRCSIMAYIRHGILQKNPDSDAQIMNLTPLNFQDILESFDSDFYSPNNEPWRQIKNKNELPNYLPDNIKECIIDFEKEYLNFSDGNEWGISYDFINCEKSDLISNGLEIHVSLPAKGRYKNSKLLVSHCHLDNSPPSPKDILNCLHNNDIYYLVIHGKKDLFIMNVKNKDASAIDSMKSEIKTCYDYGYEEALLKGNDPFDLIKTNLINNEKLNRYIDMSVVVK